jgi:ribosomal-protein-serine acetyltransferase
MFCLNVDPNLKLCLFEDRHATELFALVEANRAYLRQWMPWLDVNNTASATAEFINANLKQFAEGSGFQAGIFFQETLAGVIGFHELDHVNRSISLGYWLAAKLQGQGIVTRASRFMVGYAFTELRLNRVEIRCAVENQKSRAIPERLGFSHEGTIRQAEWLYEHFVDHAVYGMLADEWQTDSHNPKT